MAENFFEILGCRAKIEIRALKNDKSIIKFQIASNNFIHYIRDEQYAMVGKPTVGISLPTGELKVVFPSPSYALALLQTERVAVNVELMAGGSGTDNKTSLKSDYIVTNFDIDMQGGEVGLTLYLIANLGDFIDKAVIKAYHNNNEPITSIKAVYDAVANCSGIEMQYDEDAQDLAIKEDYQTNDKQIWIQGNIPTYQFVANTIKHCNPDQDLILTAINHDKLKIVSYNATINKTRDKIPVFIYVSKPKDETIENKDAVCLIGNKVALESSLGIYNYLLGVEKIPQVQMTSNKETVFGKIMNLVKTGGKTPKDVFVSDRIIAPKFDCGNTHENYWNAQLANEKKLAQIYRNTVYIQVDGYVIDDSVNLLDSAYLNLKGFATSDANGDTIPATKVLDGNFVVLGVSRYVSKKLISNRIALGRAEY